MELRWSWIINRYEHDGSDLLIVLIFKKCYFIKAGEDGQIKIWSRSGMLRSTVLQGDIPIYTATWGADSNQILIAQGRYLVIKPLAPNTKPIRVSFFKLWSTKNLLMRVFMAN